MTQLYLIKVKGSLGIKYTKILKLVENMRLLQTLKMPNKVELNYYLEDVVKILNHSEKENSVTLVFSDVRNGLSELRNYEIRRRLSILFTRTILKISWKIFSALKAWTLRATPKIIC